MLTAQIWGERDVPSELGQAGWKSDQYQCGGNCACESGIAIKSRTDWQPTKQPHYVDLDKLTPALRSNLYLTRQAGYMAAYNPQGRFGVAVLNATAEKLLELIDGKTDLPTLQTTLGLSRAQLLESLQQLEQAELIYTSNEEPKVVITSAANVSVWMHVTNQCNLRCTYCYIQKTNVQMSLETGKQALDEIFETALRHERQEIMLKFAGGEALTVFPLVQSLTEYAQELGALHHIQVIPVILTNGTPLNPQLACLLKEKDFVCSVSLDGLEEYNDVTRPLMGGQGSFKKIEKGINLLLEYGVKFNVSVVVSRYNLTHLPALTRYLLERNISFTFNFFRENELADNTLTVENDQLSYWLSHAYQVIGEVMPSYSLMNAVLDRVQFKAPHLQACGAGTNYIVVKHTGEIVGCQMHMQKPGIGKLRQGRDLLKVINEANFVAPAGRSSELKEGCAGCQWRYVCAGGCPILTFSSFGRYDTRSPFCSTYRHLIPQVLDLEAARIVRYAVTA